MFNANKDGLPADGQSDRMPEAFLRENRRKYSLFSLDKFQQNCYNAFIRVIAKFSVLQASFSFIRKKEYANG